jgi:uncharacterized protein DUF6519
MPSDRARVTFDQSRRYRSVVMQQGRVQLEADWNEQAEIGSDELRRDLRDVIGVFGTPDDGYAIAVSNPNIRAFTIGPGTMYIGGMRAYLPKLTSGVAYPYDQQPDWLPPEAPDTFAPFELVYLELFEQEIGAVEDPPLREPALGGPDTAQRLRLMQRIHRMGSVGSNCEDAWTGLVRLWRGAGLELDPDTFMLRSTGRLQVSFTGDGPPPSPCDPAAEAGYLGAENQMIRVMAQALNPHTSVQNILWSFDNASSLYRVTAYDKTKQTITLATRPVDEHHTPRQGAVVELLRGVARLEPAIAAAPPLPGEPEIRAAEPFGPTTTLAHDYHQDSRTLELNDPLPADYEPSDTNILYVRIWEEVHALGTTPTKLGSTGLQVTVSGAPTAGDFWTFAVRPLTPSEILPHRYRDAPQPPEGIRRWVCPLAVIDWHSGGIVTSCREVFDNLVALTKRRQSCCIVVKPEDLRRRTLQQIVDSATTMRGRVELCLTPGLYTLPAPLVLKVPITIEGCGPDVIIEPDVPSADVFRPGLVHVLGDDIVMRNLIFLAPAVPFLVGGSQQTRNDVEMSVAIRVAQSVDCAIEGCTFRISNPGAPVFGAAILANGVNTNLTIRDCHFFGVAFVGSGMCGIAFTPVLVRDPSFDVSESSQNIRTIAPNYFYSESAMNAVTIEGNDFDSYQIGILAWSDIVRLSVRCNEIVNCVAGVLLFAQRWLAILAFLTKDDVGAITNALDNIVKDPNAPHYRASIFSAYAMFHPSVLVPTNALLVLPPPFVNFHFKTLNAGTRVPLSELLNLLPPRADLTDNLIVGVSVKKDELLGDLGNAWSTLPRTWTDLFFVPDLDMGLIFKADPPLLSAIDVSHNRVCIDSDGGNDSVVVLTALVVATDERSQTRVIVSENDFDSRAQFFPNTLMLFIPRATVTGNLMQNEYPPRNTEESIPSLVFIAAPQVFRTTPIRRRAVTETNDVSTKDAAPVLVDEAHFGFGVAAFFSIFVAITGNDFLGFPLLPQRFSLAPPATALPPWLLLNTAVL